MSRLRKPCLNAKQKPCEVDDDPESKEHVEFWDEDEIETLKL
jgi:hypothetical protein